ncbi:hypothetical protein TD95_003436 [Thielaviopsis punctulata]|uniref:NAD-dependent epimerase/dehydratase domain-containing protein n=1 Tax=Thielaviopsis punctulata TaxID=72032 RepID=A0A0F4ZDW9_9PEZI|nr:hypothetical protein TD95_003436 [Thielaviopsis punctulata]
MASKRIIVCGGNGFVGSRICKFAVSRGWDVMSISRSGPPRWSSMSDAPSAPSWAHKVAWERANLMDASTYRSLLLDADYVVHSMGILLEADYKGLVRGSENILTGIRKIIGATSSSSGNPFLKPSSSSTSSSSSAPPRLTYEAMNRDSAVTLAREAVAGNVKAFALLSAATCPPGVPMRYLSTKREAEHVIARDMPELRSVFVRAPFMYDPSRKFTLGMAAANGAATLLDGATKGLVGGLLGRKLAKPLLVDTVAEATVEALSNENISGALEVDQIEELASQGWRNGML